MSVGADARAGNARTIRSNRAAATILRVRDTPVNYQHLFYFKSVAEAGGITAAAQRLRLTPPTLSSQIRTFEEALGVTLFERTARGMNLTEAGRTALRYADRIFTLGGELERSLRGEAVD